MSRSSPAGAAGAPRLVLVGGGHAHVEILRRLAVEDHPPVRATLVSAFPEHHYSGMVPGYVAGLYREDELTFDLPALCRRAGTGFVAGWAERIDAAQRRLLLADGRFLDYDLASFAVGSRAAGGDTPGVDEHALAIKPLAKAVEVRRRLEELAGRRGSGTPASAPVVVVGGGAAGVETAFAAAQRLEHGRAKEAEDARAAGGRGVVLLEGGGEILDQGRDRFRRKVRRTLAERGVEVATGTPVAAVEEGAVRLADGRRRPAALVLWLTGPAAPPLFTASGLPTDDPGFLSVDATLRVPGHPELFAAGDCATLVDRPRTPKAGVYAVRQAPVLWRSLTASLAGLDPAAEGVAYEPQRGFLSLLNVGDGTALLSWKAIAARGRWAWWLKDRIDRRFMRRYRKLYRGGSAGG